MLAAMSTRGVKPGINHHVATHQLHRAHAIVPRRPLQHHDLPESWCRSPLPASPLVVPRPQHDPARDLIKTDAVTADADAAASGSGGIGTVMLSVLAAAMGAFSFGYALSVVNGPLDAIALDLGFAGDAALQGLVCGHCNHVLSYTFFFQNAHYYISC